jgi:hypothetical protein
MIFFIAGGERGGGGGWWWWWWSGCSGEVVRDGRGGSHLSAPIGGVGNVDLSKKMLII